jgi:predicted membrane protein
MGCNTSRARSRSCRPLAITLGLTVYPGAIAPDGTVHHALLTLLLWGVAAGFVYGVGYVPESRVWRWLLGPAAAFAFMAAGLGFFPLAAA